MATALTRRNSDSVLGFIHMLSTRFGVPYRVITDRASCFCHEFHAYCQTQGIIHDMSSAYHPETNGLVERTIGSLKSILRKMIATEPQEKWDLFVDQATFNLNVRDHSSIGFTPFYLAHGCSPRMFPDDVPPRLFDYSNEVDRNLYTARELDLLGQSRAAALFRSNAEAAKMKTSHDSDHAIKSNRFAVGEFVIRMKRRLSSVKIPQLESRWEGPFIIHAVLPNDAYMLKRPDGSIESHPVNANHLAPFTATRSPDQQLSGLSTDFPFWHLVIHRQIAPGLSLRLWKGG
jgi:transposase InsO family protein